MKCDNLLKNLNDYIDGDVTPAICEELEKHLAACQPCHLVMDNIRKTIEIYKDGKPYPMPEGFRSRLHESLRASYGRRFSK